MRIRLLFLGIALAIVLPATDATAQGRRARLSKDLVERISIGDSDGTSVIVTGSQAGVEALAARHGLRIRKRLRTGAVLEVPAGSLRGVTEDADVDTLSGNQVLHSSMAVTNVAIGADQAWEGVAGLVHGVTGKGVGVAVIDSGIANVPALRSRVVASLDFTDDRGRGIDQWGHGTHVAGIIAADGDQTLGQVQGVAPDAHLVSLKVLDEDGKGTADNVIEAIDWVVEHHKRYRIRVINLSLGGAVLQSWQDDPICQAVQRAYEENLVVVASAGNFGKTEDGVPILGGITVPGNCPHSITVGALNTKGTAFRSDDEVATYSSKGPTLYDGLLKPDFVAPGNKILSLVAPNSTLVLKHPELLVGRGSSAQLQLSGTSMSTAVVSGIATQLIEQNRYVTPTAIRFRLQYSSSPVTGSGRIAAGSGSVNALAALKLETPDQDDSTLIAGETVTVGGLLSAHPVIWEGAVTALHGQARNILWGNARNILWGNAKNILWGNARNILWGNAADNILWGNARNILWGNVADNILWGNAKNILWGNARNILWGNANNILWGNAADNILWGNGLDSILWGNAADNILWGNAVDNILRGNSAENILWGDARNILWGNAADNILWGNARNILWGNGLVVSD